MLSIMNLIDEDVAVVVSNNDEGIITIDDFAQLNEKSWKVSVGYSEGLEVLVGECPVPGLQCQRCLEQTYRS